MLRRLSTKWVICFPRDPGKDTVMEWSSELHAIDISWAPTLRQANRWAFFQESHSSFTSVDERGESDQGYIPSKWQSRRLEWSLFQCHAKYTLLLSLHSGNNFPILIGNLHCLLTHPTAHNTVFGTNEQSPTADLTWLYACPHVEKQGTTSDQITLVPIIASCADRGPVG